MRKVELFPTRDCEAGYGPDKSASLFLIQLNLNEPVSQLQHKKYSTGLS